MTKEEIITIINNWETYCAEMDSLEYPVSNSDFVDRYLDKYANQKKEVNYQCNKCGAIYTSSSDYVGCCTMHDINRTSGVCGGELIKKEVKQVSDESI